MQPAGESWVTESVTGVCDHVVLGTSLPLLLPRGIHRVEAWNEAVCGGPWGRASPGQGSAPAGPRPGALGRVPPLVRELRAAAGRAGRGLIRRPAGLGHGHLRRCAQQLPGAGVAARHCVPQRHLAGGLLARAQRPAAALPPRLPVCRVGSRRPARHRAGARRWACASRASGGGSAVVRGSTTCSRRSNSTDAVGTSASTARRGIPAAGGSWNRSVKRTSPDREFTQHSAHAPPEKQFLERYCKRSQRIYDPAYSCILLNASAFAVGFSGGPVPRWLSSSGNTR